MNNSISAAFNNPTQQALTQMQELMFGEPIGITFSQAVAAQDEITAEQYETERQEIEIEQERILRHGDCWPFENG